MPAPQARGGREAEETSVSWACALNVLCSAAVMLLVNIGVLSVVQATLGLIAALEGRNAVMRRSSSRLRRFLKWLVFNAAASIVIAIGSFANWYDSHCDDAQRMDGSSSTEKASCKSKAHESSRKYAIVELVWAAVAVVTAFLVCRLLMRLQQLKTQAAVGPPAPAGTAPRSLDTANAVPGNMATPEDQISAKH